MRKRTLAAVVSAAVIATLGAVIPAAAAQAAAGPKVASGPVWIRQSDFIPDLSDTRTKGHLQFIADGLHLWTEDNSSQSKVAEYWAVSGSLASMEGSGLDWWGTSPPPGAQIVFDAAADGNGTKADKYNILVGEPIYNGDWWLTGGSGPSAHLKCPLTNGGSGSDCHGTLAEWAIAMPDAKVYAGGFSLGSGVLGNGLLYTATYGNTVYHFTSVPAVKTSTLAVAPRSVVLGKPVTASGSLKSGGVGVAGAVVTLSRAVGKSWVPFSSVKTAANGTWAKAFLPSATWTIRATSAGFPAATGVVTVTSRVNIKAIGRTVYVGVAPNLAGKKVLLQRHVGAGWVTDASATLSRTSTTMFRASRAGVYRVVAPAVPGYATGVSTYFLVR